MADSEPDDFALLDAWCAGDRRAGNALIERHFTSLWVLQTLHNLAEVHREAGDPERAHIHVERSRAFEQRPRSDP